MKHLKSMAAAALALAALLSLPALPSFASDAGGKDSSAADSAGLTCGSCGAGCLVLTGTTSTEWISLGVEGAVPCVHHDPWRLDEVLERTVTRFYACGHCGQTSRESVQETRYVHHP